MASSAQNRIELEKQQKAYEYREETGFKLKDDGGYSLAEWMENVGRVVGGTQLTEMYSPFSGGLQ